MATGLLHVLRCRTSKGATVALQGVTSASTMAELRAAIIGAEGVSAESVVTLQLKANFPPKSLEAADDVVLSTLGLRAGDIVIVASIQVSVQTSAATKTTRLVQRTIADDNSCLFNSISFVLQNKTRNGAPQLRQIVASCIASDPSTYIEAVLGRSNAEYCRWITQPDSWGGGVELAILSEHFKCEIYAVDVQTIRIDRFGQDAGYDKCVFVIYNGIHYDALASAQSPNAPESADETVFSTIDKAQLEVVVQQAMAIATELHKAHKFTDLANFTLRCSLCRAGLKGQKEAQAHALSTGHGAFEEYYQ